MLNECNSIFLKVISGILVLNLKKIKNNTKYINNNNNNNNL
jgi:hypothetical protein